MKKYLLLFILYTHYLLLFNCFAQQNDTTQVNTLFGKAKYFIKAGKSDSALYFLNKAIGGEKILKGRELLLHGYILFERGKIFLNKGNYKSAQKDLWEAFLIKKKILGESHQDFENSLFYLGKLFFEVNHLLIAERIFENDLEVAGKIFGERHNRYAEILDVLGEIRTLKGDFANAEIYHHKAADIIKVNSGEKSVLYGINLVNQGFLYAEKGYYTAAEALYRQALLIYKRSLTLKDPAYLKLSIHLADLYFKLNNYAEAAYLLKRVINIYQDFYEPNHPVLARVEYNFAQLYLTSGFFSIAKKHIDRSLEISAPLGRKHLSHLLAQSALAEYYRKTKKFKESDSLYNLVLDTMKVAEGEKSLWFAKMESHLANLYYTMGKYDAAIAYHQRSLELKKELLDESHPDYIQTINDLSLIFWAAKKYNQAERYFNKSVNNYIRQFNRYFAFLSEKEKSVFYNNIRTFFDKYHSFIIDCRKSKSSLLGEIYNDQLATKALLFHSTQQIRKQIYNGKDPSLLDKYYRWVHLKEHLAKLYKLDPEEVELQNIPIDSLEDAANYLEKELSLRVEISKNKKGEGLQEFYWQDIKSKLAENEAAIEIVRIPHFNPDSGGMFTGQVFYASVIIRSNINSGPQLVLLENGKELENKYINYYRNTIHFHVLDELSYLKFWAPIQQSSALKDIKNIFLSVDGVYNQININTLFNIENKKFVFDEIEIHLLTNTKDIIKVKEQEGLSSNFDKSTLFGYPDYYYKGKIDTLLSEGLKKHGDKIPHHHTRGNIDNIFRDGNITSLPGTKLEIEKLESIFIKENKKARKFLGIKANEGELKNLVDPGILHIATHGFFLKDQDLLEEVPDSTSEAELLEEYESNPLMRCGIMLSKAGYAFSDETLEAEIKAVDEGKSYEDGILTAYEAMNLNLNNTELVVLSACETGLGEVKNGEGVYGLQRAFQTAGAKSIIMSLWKVGDLATQKLMVNFYEEWIKTGNKRQAIRYAMESLRKEFPEPAYWGAFILIGQ